MAQSFSLGSYGSVGGACSVIERQIKVDSRLRCRIEQIRGMVSWTSIQKSLTPFHETDIIVINPYLKPEHNDYVVVSNEEGEATFKQLKKYGRTRVLHPLNPKYDDIELRKDTEYRVVGVVIEKKILNTHIHRQSEVKDNGTSQ